MLATSEKACRNSGLLLVTALLIGSPLLLLSLGRRAETVLPAMRNWMNDNAWVVSEIVLGLFLVLQLQSIFSS